VAHVSVVIPVYKAEDCLDELYRQLTLSLGSITDDYEIILVEDCGGDRSWEIIERLAAADQRVRGLQFSRNFGQHYGITAGLDHCDGDWVVVMDCDLQDRPDEIPRLYAKAMEGFDVVLARRGQRRDSRLKRWTSGIFYRIFGYLADMDYDGEVGNFRMVSRRVVESLRLMRERLRFFGGLVAWVGFPTASVDVRHADRFAGETSYSYARLWRLATEIIIAHSDKPLRLAVKAGFAISLAAFIYGGFVAFRAIVYGTPITGWSSLIVSIYFLGGIIISLLGVLGVYLGKTFDESKRRPLYIVRRSTGPQVPDPLQRST
jgi:polyisoprenyl-phosphate glycosyltransferase